MKLTYSKFEIKQIFTIALFTVKETHYLLWPNINVALQIILIVLNPKLRGLELCVCRYATLHCWCSDYWMVNHADLIVATTDQWLQHDSELKLI